MADDEAIWRDAGPRQLERMRRRAVGEQLLAAAEHDRHREDAHRVDQVIGEQSVDEFGAALGDEVRAVFLLQALHVGDVAQDYGARPARIDLARARDHVLLDVVEQPGDAAVGGVFVVVGPVPREDLVGLAAQQEVEFLLEDAADLFAARSIEIGHRPAAELEAPGWILERPAGCLHDAIHGNLGADDDLSHWSLSLLESRTNRDQRMNFGCKWALITRSRRAGIFATPG